MHLVAIYLIIIGLACTDHKSLEICDRCRLRLLISVQRFAVRLARPALMLLIAVLIVWGGFYLSFNHLLHAAQETLRSRPAPIADYVSALARFRQIQETEGLELNPACDTILLTHGHRTERAVVLFHGFTNCPQQFRELGHTFYDLGYNVLIPRLPRHGLADRKVENLSPLKAEELRDCADTSVDIACGLGQKVYVCGLSAGGTLAAWIAQNRSDVTRAVLIAPALGLTRREGTHLQKGIAFLLPLLPDIRIDWYGVDPDAPGYAYPGFSSRALGQILRVSMATFAEAFDHAPQVQDVVLVTSKSDETVSDYLAWQLIGIWRGKGLANFTAVDFPKAMAIDHDMIDPTHKNQQTQIVYPVIVSLLNAP
jgi:pimeloyl-ACP methyl ester carboxylesterase